MTFSIITFEKVSIAIIITYLRRKTRIKGTSNRWTDLVRRWDGQRVWGCVRWDRQVVGLCFLWPPPHGRRVTGGIMGVSPLTWLLNFRKSVRSEDWQGEQVIDAEQRVGDKWCWSLWLSGGTGRIQLTKFWDDSEIWKFVESGKVTW